MAAGEQCAQMAMQIDQCLRNELLLSHVLRSPFSPRGTQVRVSFTRHCLLVLHETPPGLTDGDGDGRSTHRRRPDDPSILKHSSIKSLARSFPNLPSHPDQIIWNRTIPELN